VSTNQANTGLTSPTSSSSAAAAAAAATATTAAAAAATATATTSHIAEPIRALLASILEDSVQFPGDVPVFVVDERRC
jgi:hypothetical protein